jgi:ABC-2 type transport system permease protein
MRNYWLVAKHEYRRVVIRRGFLIGTLIIPLGIAALIGLVIVVESMGQDNSPVGFVDQAGVLDVSLLAARPDDAVEIRAYADEEAALAALNAHEVQAFFVLPPDYVETLASEQYYLSEPLDNDVWREFDDFVRLNLVSRLPENIKERLLEGPSVTVRDISSNREFSEEKVVNIILPFIGTAFFFITTMSASGYMLQAVADEKENRMMEVMVTSVTPTQLIGGKAVGLLAAALTQMVIWVVAAVIGLIIAAPFVSELQYAEVPWAYVGLMVLFFFPSYALIAAIMVAVGAAVTDVQQGQQLAGLLNMLFLLPIFLLGVLFTNPDHALWTVMTLFPTTAFLSVSLRWALGTVPMWQLVLGWTLTVATTVGMVWVAARIFRAGMLRYGQPLNLKAAVEAVRGS